MDDAQRLSWKLKLLALQGQLAESLQAQPSNEELQAASETLRAGRATVDAASGEARLDAAYRVVRSAIKSLQN